jgi:PIN domain nuclease of toxin-antitoxin system
VQSLLSASAITPINLAEVAKKLRERDVPGEDIRATVSDLRLPVELGPASQEQAIELGELACARRTLGLSIGDAICLAVAGWWGRTAVTTNRRWSELPRNSGRTILTIR